MSVAALLLTGGAGRRLGAEKSGLVLDGETLANRGARTLVSVCDPVLEVGVGASSLPHVADPVPGLGPLAGLVAGSDALRKHGYDGPVVLLGVDHPFVTGELVRLLADWEGAATAVPLVDGHPQTASARYGADACAAAPSLLDAGVRSLRALLDAVPWDALDDAHWGTVATANAFVDVDTPADAARLGIRIAK